MDWLAKLLAEDWAAVGMKVRLIQRYAASIKGNFDWTCKSNVVYRGLHFYRQRAPVITVVKMLRLVSHKIMTTVMTCTRCQ